MRKILILTSIFVLFSLLLQAQTYWDREIICVEKDQETLKKLVGMNLDLLMEKDGEIYIVAGTEDLANLNTNNTLRGRKIWQI